MRKKLIALLMATLMLLSLAAACGNRPAETPDPAPATPTEPTPTPTTPTNPAPAEPADPDADKYGGDLVVASSNISTTIDPHNSQGTLGNYSWMVNVYDTILSRAANGDVYPLICDYTQSEDGKIITLTMREYYYHNGEQIEIEDVLASMERGTHFSGSWADTWSHVVEKTIEGDTLTLKFDKLVVDFLPTIAYINPCAFVLPKELCEQYGATPIEDPSVLDGWGSGCYILEEYNPDVAIKVKRNENYVTTMNEGATGIAAPRKAYMDTITWAVNTDSASRTAAMIAGEYHVGGILTEMRPYAQSVGLKEVPLYNQWTHAIFFNLDESNADSPVADVNFRKAIRACLDMKAVALSIYQGDETAMDLNCSAVVPGNVYWNDIIESTEWNIADKELAKEYLAKTDYNGEPIKWLCSANSGFYRQAMGCIPQLEEIGINVELMVVDSGSHGAMRGDPATGHDIGGWETQKSVFNPVGSTSLICQGNGWWGNERKDELYDIMCSTPNGSKESIDAYTELCQLIADNVPWIGFCTTISKTYTQPNLEMNYEGLLAYYWNAYFTK